MLAVKKATKLCKTKSKTGVMPKMKKMSKQEQGVSSATQVENKPITGQITNDAIEIIERMASNLAHEARTPLAVIKLAVENSESFINGLSNSNIATSLKKQLKMIKGAADSIINTIDMHMTNLRYAVMPDAKPNQVRKLHIKELVTEALEEYPLADTQRKLVYWNPPLNDDFVVMGNVNHCKHIIFNLLKNSLTAIKHAGKGKIHIATRQTPKQCTLSIKDTALGMNDEQVRNLFLGKIPVRGDRLGLGLRFCKRVINEMGGEISCKAKPRRYAEFVLSFPKASLG